MDWNTMRGILKKLPRLVAILLFANLFSPVIGGNMFVGTFYHQKCEYQGDCGEFICLNKTCVECSDDKSCLNMNHICRVQQEFDGNSTRNMRVCIKKGLFRPYITVYEIIATVCCVIAGTIASSAGMGGSALHIPILLLIAQYSTHETVPRSASVIAGTYFVSFCNEFFYKHPKKRIPVIEYNMVMQIIPIILYGTICGVLLNRMCPDWFILSLLVIILSMGSVRSFVRSIKMFWKEMKILYQKRKYGYSEIEDLDREKEAADEIQDSEDSEENVIVTGTNVSHEDISTISMKSDKFQTFVEEVNNIKVKIPPEDLDEKSPLVFSPSPSNVMPSKITRKKTLAARILGIVTWYESCQIQIFQTILIFMVWSVVFVFSLLKGTKTVHSIINVKMCSWQYWTLFVAPIPILLLSLVLSGIVLCSVHGIKLKQKYKYVEGQIKWNFWRTFFIPMIFFVVGVCCGMLGIGGGVVNSIVLLEIGLTPTVTLATLALLGFATSSATLLGYLVEGLISYDYLLWYFGWGVVASLLGRVIIGYFFRKMKKKFIIVFVISFVVVLSTILLASIGIEHLIVDFVRKDWDSFKFVSPC